jgi:hypothetical protein
LFYKVWISWPGHAGISIRCHLPGTHCTVLAQRRLISREEKLAGKPVIAMMQCKQPPGRLISELFGLYFLKKMTNALMAAHVPIPEDAKERFRVD